MIGLCIALAYAACVLVLILFNRPVDSSRKLIADVVLVIPFFTFAVYVGAASTVGPTTPIPLPAAESPPDTETALPTDGASVIASQTSLTLDTRSMVGSH